jgi:germination protein M
MENTRSRDDRSARYSDDNLQSRRAARRRRKYQVRRRRLTALLILGLLISAALLAALFLSGCGSGEVGDAGPAAPTTTPTETRADADAAATTTTEPGTATTERPADGTPTTQPTGEPLRVLVYFVRGEELGAAHRMIPRTQEVGAAAMRALLEGPNNREREEGELGTSIPEGTAFLGLNIQDGLATVDLSQEFASGGGTLSMTTRIAQVVYTLTQFPSVDRVSFHLDGQPVEAIGGEGLVVDPPVSRSDYEGVTPAILVESPTVGDRVSSPMRITGTANVFEATLQVNIVDWDGLIIAEEMVTATSGSGTRGTFDVTVPFDVERSQRGALIAFTYSAKDGSQQDVVEIPLELLP